MIVRIPQLVQVKSTLFKVFLRHQNNPQVVKPFENEKKDRDLVPTGIDLNVEEDQNDCFFTKELRLPDNFFEGITFSTPVFIAPLMCVYIGQFQDGIREGLGLLIYSDGSFYEGNFANNSPNGVGVTCYNNGSCYRGQYWNGLRQGSGTFKCPNDEIIQGLFKNDEVVGHATVTYTNNAQYIGNLINYKKEGTGKFIFQNEDFYEGQFKNDLFEGKGKFYRKKDQTVFEGDWHQNQLLNPCRIYYPNQSIYDGEVTKFIRHGKGRLREFEKVYEGVWQNDMKEGVFRISIEGATQTKLALFSNNAFSKFLSEKAALRLQNDQKEEPKVTETKTKAPERVAQPIQVERSCRFFCF
jgi:hypothetical protein